MEKEKDSEEAAALRERMVRQQIRARGIGNERVLATLLAVPRHLFAAGRGLETAYADHALSIGQGQTISQPYMVAVMTRLLVEKAGRPGKVLEIGTGSGYQAAILSHLFEEVFTIERIEPLADEAEERLRSLGRENVTVVRGDGTLGHPPASPYDAILVTAAAPHVPEALKAQLADGGVLVIPVGSRLLQELEVITRSGSELRRESADGCVFVPLIGKDGWEG